MKSIFEYRDYKPYLTELATEKGQRSGFKSALARACGCNNAYISSVLNGAAHFSLEQAERIGVDLKMARAELHFFLLLVQKARAGTVSLQHYFDQQIKIVIEQQLNVENRMGAEGKLGKEQQSEYYSSWVYAAVHVATSVPRLAKSADTIADYLDLPLAMVKNILSFLEGCKLIANTKKGYVPGTRHIHLGQDSKNILRHHTNWRMRMLRSLEYEDEQKLNYSSALTLSREDSFRVREILLAALKSSAEVIMASPEEEVFALTLDFVSLKKT